MVCNRAVRSTLNVRHGLARFQSSFVVQNTTSSITPLRSHRANLICGNLHPTSHNYGRLFSTFSETSKDEASDITISSSTPRVCIVGTGPSAMYTAKYILRDSPDALIDFVERLPVPFGLVRFGVAPDHPEAKIVTKDFTQSVLASPNVRFFGNVEVGVDVTLEQLRETYDAVVLAVGARASKNLGIPGEDLNGIHDAREFVAWYNGHPDMASADFELKNVTDVVIIGNGNVALDVARILLKTPEELNLTDIPLSVRDKLRNSAVRRVGVYGRRGPVQGAYTIAELREITTAALRPVITNYNHQDVEDLGFDPENTSPLASDDALVSRSGLIIPQGNYLRGLNAASEVEATARALKRKTDLIRSIPDKAKALGMEEVDDEKIASHRALNAKALKEIRFDPENPPEIRAIPNDRTLILDYLMRPDHFEASEKDPSYVGSVVFERTDLVGEAGKQQIMNTGEFVHVPSRKDGKLLVIKSVGYRSVPIEGAPFDTGRNVFPTLPGGRVKKIDSDDVESGLYATGWARRGPTGIIGTNIGDARETAGSVCDDITALEEAKKIKAKVDPESLSLLWNHVKSKKAVVDKAACHRILKRESELGLEHNVHNVKINTNTGLLEASRVRKAH